MKRRFAGLILVLLAGVGLAAPARAQTPPAADRIGGWTVGTLAFATPPYAVPDVPDRMSDLHDKVRIGGSSVPGTDGGAVVRSWVSVEPAGNGRLQAVSGLLLDVPIGSFVFTPSLGAGYVSRSALEAAPSIEFRSQLELGYEFENKSRFTVGYSRITSGADDGRDADNVFGLYYRLPFGAFAGQ